LDHIDDIKRFDPRIGEVTLKINAGQRLGNHPHTELRVGPINAGLILGEVGGVSRFPTRNHFASYTGDNNRHRLNWAGNRQLNHANQVIAITHIRYDTPGRAYYRRKLAQGKSS
jgi:transposase